MAYKENKKLKYGEIILDLREKNNLTQSQLGEKIGVNSNAISKWENGLTLPNEENLAKLNQIFNTSIEKLFNNDVEDLNKKSIPLKNKIIFSTITAILLIIILFLSVYFLNNYDKCQYYSIESKNQSYGLNGSVIKFPDRVNIFLSNIYINDKEITSNAYQLSLYIDDICVYIIGNIDNIEKEKISINQYLQKTSLNLSNEVTTLIPNNLDEKNIYLSIDYKNNSKTKNIRLDFTLKKSFSNNKLLYN